MALPGEGLFSCLAATDEVVPYLCYSITQFPA